jgi:hypothetical protein
LCDGVVVRAFALSGPARQCGDAIGTGIYCSAHEYPAFGLDFDEMMTKQRQE